MEKLTLTLGTCQVTVESDNCTNSLIREYPLPSETLSKEFDKLKSHNEVLKERDIFWKNECERLTQKIKELEMQLRLVNNVDHISHPVDYTTPEPKEKRGYKYVAPKDSRKCVTCGKDFMPNYNRTTKCNECRGIKSDAAAPVTPGKPDTKAPDDDNGIPRHKSGAFVIEPIANSPF